MFSAIDKILSDKEFRICSDKHQICLVSVLEFIYIRLSRLPGLVYGKFSLMLDPVDDKPDLPSARYASIREYIPRR